MTTSKKNHTAWWGAFILVLVMMVTACGNNKGNTNESGQAATNTATATTEAPASTDAEGERVIEHAMGKTTVKGTPQRVVVLTNEGTEALLALGVKPVGAVKSWTGSPWYDHIKDQMQDVTELGEESQPNLELIAGLKPDLILANKMRHEKIYEQLSAIAPTVESETLRGAWKDNFKLYAQTLGLTEEGDKLIADFDGKIEQFKTKAGDKLKETVSVVRFMGGKTRVYHTDTFTGIIFNQIGITRNAMTLNAKEQFADEITKERLPETDADRIFYFTYETGDGKASETEKEWTNDSLWTSLSAVKNGKVFKVDDAIWNTAGGIIAAQLVIDQLYEIYEVK